MRHIPPISINTALSISPLISDNNTKRFISETNLSFSMNTQLTFSDSSGRGAITSQLEEMYQRLQKTAFTYPLETIATAWQMSNDVVMPYIPRLLAFPCEDMETSLSQLLITLRTPTSQTENYLLGTDNDIAQYDRIVGRGDHPGYWGALMLNFLHNRHNNHNECSILFSDKARMFPQYGQDWLKDISELYGPQRVEDARKDHKDLFDILYMTAIAAELFLTEDDGFIESLGGIPKYIDFMLEWSSEQFSGRQGDHCESEEPICTLRAAAKALDPKFAKYREVVAKLRGIPIIYDCPEL
jgi:hypothetical protein